MFNLQEEKDKFSNAKDIKFRVLSLFFSSRGMWDKFENKAQLSMTVKRHIRDAKLIVDGQWSRTRVEKVMNELNADPYMRDKWTLQTVFKILTK